MGKRVKRFQPELGQMGFSNSGWEEEEMPEYVEAALRYLASEIERVEWNITQKEYQAPIGNNGAKYETETFKMEAYCWCDGEEEHKNGCPPNFIHKPSGFRVRWYKHLGRGSSCAKGITPTKMAKILDECLASVRKKEEGLW